MSQSELHPAAPVAATIYRGESVENTHLAHVAVVDAPQRLNTMGVEIGRMDFSIELAAHR
ncbi:L-asparaginase II [Paraburkholderia sp. MM5496-R1]|uniref:Uncharacterized protein n=1 Tax=Paraburkholderia tuberum TaxID=157910 RepID=A0A1H1G4C9_9BURK|nr:hypothetical protein SAMN05445850_2705 [Paraburkholderia tuberum]